MFVISKRNFKVRRADGTLYGIKKDYVGDIPDDVYNAPLIQNAKKSGWIVVSESHKDKDLYKADEEAEKKQEASDIRPDAKKPESEESEEPEEEEKAPKTTGTSKSRKK